MASIYDEKTGRYRDSDGTEYILAKMTGGAAADGDLVIRDADNTTATQESVKASSTTAQDTTIVGVAKETIASGSVGKIHVYGYKAVVKIDGTTTSVAIGDTIAGGIVAKKASKLEYANISATLGGARLGICLATVATGSDETFAAIIDPR